MYVRLAFAVAAHLEPEILIVDEVLAVGDAQFQKKCMGKMEEVGKEGRTVLFVSHNMSSIQALCHRCVLLLEGTVKTIGNTCKVIPEYVMNNTDCTKVEADLANHRGRSQTQQYALKKIWIEDKQRIKTNTLLMGERVKFYITFSCNYRIVNPGFGFGIDDAEGRRIFSMNNYLKPTKHNTFKTIQAGTSVFDLESLPLLPGNYSISVSLVEDKTTWIDYVEHAISFSVQANDVFKSGKIPERRQGIIFVFGDIYTREMPSP